MTPAAALVDPFWGVDGAGSCLPGPYRPYSLCRPGPDIRPPQAQSGYRSGQPLWRFSQMHVSGTGGGGRYGCIGLWPFSGWRSGAITPEMPSEESGDCGRWRCVLQPSGITVEVASADRAALWRFTYPARRPGQDHFTPTLAPPQLVVDLGAVIDTGGDPGASTGASIGGWLEQLDTQRLAGRADLRGGWGHDFPYSVHTFIATSAPVTGCTLRSADGPVRAGTVAVGRGCQAILAFPPGERVIEVRVGVSMASVANARAAAEGLPGFDELAAAGVTAWESELSRVRVTGGSEDDQRLLYSALHRLFCMPTDLGVDDEHVQWRSGVRQWSDFYCLWDSVRNANSLLMLLDPARSASWLNALLDIAGRTGWLPDAWIAGHSAAVQGGSSADVILAEAAQKGLPGVDWSAAVAAVRRNLEVDSPQPRLSGRYLADYRDLGYCSTRVPQCVSRHLEYSYQDWCIARLAEMAGDHDLAVRAEASAAKLWTLWDPARRCFAPKDPDGGWAAPFDPAKPQRPDYWADPHCYEGTAREWSLTPLHDIAGLVEAHGGAEAFAAHLDAFFANGIHLWKEIILHTPWLYHWAGRPDRSAEQVRAQLRNRYRLGRAGLPENEDMGSHSAFIVGALCGIYPVPGTDLWLLHPPAFARSDLALGDDGLRLVIDAAGAGPEQRYLAGVELDGRAIDRAWLRHAEIAGGGTLRLRLVDQPQGFGPTPPPSPLRRGRRG